MDRITIAFAVAGGSPPARPASRSPPRRAPRTSHPTRSCAPTATCHPALDVLRAKTGPLTDAQMDTRTTSAVVRKKGHRFRDVYPLSPELRKKFEEEKKDKP